MELIFGKFYFLDENDWPALRAFFYMSEADGKINVSDVDGEFWEIPKSDLFRLCLHPISYPMDNEIYILYRFVRDMASSILRQYERLSVDKLIELLSEDERVDISQKDLVFFLKSLVANESFVAKSDGREKVKRAYLTLGAGLKEHEKQRVFAASIASELDALSSRIRLIISHSGTVGTYRENLLQNVLRKHLPERYHVATGFIYGCPIQLDILIYDRLEYAPLFREGDLVVVPANAVRAVIEVKTTLTSDEVRKSLRLLSAVSKYDDGFPPMFKGIFAFESELSEKSLVGFIEEYYVPEPFSEECDADIIVHPFDHLTCVCVLERHFAYVQYDRDGCNKLVPRLYIKKSHTDLKSQAAFFMHSLLAHLRFGGMKNNDLRHMDVMLGYDSVSSYKCDLVDGEWGPYFFEAEGVEEGPERVKSMESQLDKVQRWLDGAPTSWGAE